MDIWPVMQPVADMGSLKCLFDGMLGSMSEDVVQGLTARGAGSQCAVSVCGLSVCQHTTRNPVHEKFGTTENETRKNSRETSERVDVRKWRKMHG